MTHALFRSTRHLDLGAGRIASLFFCLSGLYELAMRLVTEHLPLETASILRKEWEHDTVYTYPLLFGMDYKDCHGSHLKVYATWLDGMKMYMN